DIRIYKRTHQMEKVLPEFLVIVSTNLKAGMSMESSLWNAVRPKFGVLAHEITLISKKVMTGKDVTESLADFANKYDSPELKRTIGLIISEIEIGGKVSKIIDDIVVHLKNTAKLKRQMQASVISYVIFISTIVIVIAPVLFALSYHLLVFVSSFVVKVSASLSSSNAPSFLSSISGEGVDTDSFKNFAYVAIGTISFLSSIIVSIIEKGDLRGGLKYIPVFLLGSLAVFFITLSLLELTFGGVTL
ncbi:MAG: type II secretion system F family protein, partial [bacterium]